MFNAAKLEFFIFGVNSNQTFISQILKFSVPSEKKVKLFNPFGFEAESDFDDKTPKIKSQLIKTSNASLLTRV